jgi:hypothetical protein
MSYRALFVFVEGNDDRRFFDVVCAPMIRSDVSVEIYEWASSPTHRTAKLLAALPHIAAKPENEVGFLFLADANGCACPSARKERLRERFPNLPEDHIIVVMRMIEGWYLAGLDAGACETLGCAELRETDTVDKSGFEAAFREPVTIDLKERVLAHFNAHVACQKNASFAYLLRRMTASPLVGP